MGGPVRRLSRQVPAREDPRVWLSKARQPRVPWPRRLRAPASPGVRLLSERARQRVRMSERPQEVVALRDETHPVEALERGLSPLSAHSLNATRRRGAAVGC